MKYNQRKRFTLPSLMLCALSGLLVLVAMSPNSLAQTTIREYQKAWPTYPYSDANPVPAFTKFYPYCRFDGFADKPIQKEWKVVELSNEYLTLEILPEIGGKIWDVKEKSTGKSIIYSNPAIKFRDVGMRGPWTSGGIEFNVGIIGHTPNCSSPVDYATKTNADGSVSCVIGALDLIARAWWSVEINLPPKCSVFAMKVKWHNGSGQNQTYYNWTNVGVPAGVDLECIDPGTYHIGHDGKAASWPLDPDTGRNLAWYKNNNFGTYKSYHVLGAPSEFYGAYWHDAKYGVASYLSMDAKRGRKIWMWGLSRQGMIWENLLTDKPGGQYVEIQAGRLFNQCRGESSFTPFKDREFAPYSSELWTEYWMPVLDTGGFNAVSPAGSMNVKVGKSKTGKHKVDVAICPNRFIKETLRVFQGTKLLYEKNVSLAPTRTFKFSQEWTDSADTNKASEKQVPSPGRDVRVVLGENLLVWPAEGTGTLTRPVVSSFDQKSETSPTGLFYQGREAARDRRLNEADAFYLRACKLDPLYVPAYAALAESANRRGDWHAAIKWSRKALEIDTYCAEANYQFAFASFRLNQLADAKEGFALAALPDGKRSAALTALAIVYLSEKRYARSYDAAQKALVYNTANTDAMIAKIASLRLMSKQDQAATHEKPEQLAANMLNAQPLAFQARAELYLLGRQSPSQFLDAVRCELPHETFLELATWYRNAGRNDDAVRLLRLALKKDGIRDAEIRYWLAYLTKDSQELDKAEQASLDFCFPFRIEALDVFRWAQKQNRSWRSSWCLALTLGHLGYMEQAKKLLAECQQVPDYAPFYALRGSLAGKDGLKDIAHTLAMTPADARYAADY
ncbi:MAG: DUF5107 domain-containing protein, partial [Thermoguttaceae bacterium]|nr:DUF5107 domain-containing protein [Thermoguttaceae bacterium]